nr:glycosyltransferase [Lachnospiraceae bacterium]
MGKLNRTLSFLKRNGVVPTCYAAMERLGKFGPDPDQVRANEYYGLFSEEMLNVKAESSRYKFSVVVPAYETKEVYLCEMIDSVLAQTYGNWQLVIADASSSDRVEQAVMAYGDERIRYERLKENKSISENTNEALKYADGDFIGLLDHDDRLHPEALAEIARVLEHNSYEMVYTDEDKINEDSSVRFEPNYKPDFNFDFLLSNNYICHFTVLSKALMSRLSFREEYDGAQDYDLFLQAVLELEKQHHQDVISGEKPQNGASGSYIPYDRSYLRKKIGHVPRILYHWRAHMASTADNPESKRYAYEAGKRALETFAKESGWKVTVEHTKHLGFYEMRYHPDIFAVRKDVMAVCGKIAERGRIVSGPVVDGTMRFEGMNEKYSGYMHRAVLTLEADGADEACVRLRTDKAVSGEDKAKCRMVYLPDFVVRKQK